MHYTIISELMKYVELCVRQVLQNVSEKLKGRYGWTSILMMLQVIACTFIRNAFHHVMTF